MLPDVSGMLLRNTGIFTCEFALPFVKDFKEYITHPKAVPQNNKILITAPHLNLVNVKLYGLIFFQRKTQD